MDDIKKASFVRAAKRQKFSKGGMIRKLGNRKYFDTGGTALGGSGTSTVNSQANPNTGVLGTVGNALGLNNQFAAGAANTMAGTNQAQLNNAYSGVQGALGGQGVLNNSLAYQANPAIANQDTLANQYLAMSQGQGPNPALAQLNQTTAQNVNQQAALEAGQRGASANVGLMARQIAQQGAATQQQAAGQAATMEAQQQIAAQQNLAALTNQQLGQTLGSQQATIAGQQGEQSALEGANTAYNNAQVGMQSNINSTNASAAAANQGMMGSLLGGIGSAAGAAGGFLSNLGGGSGIASSASGFGDIAGGAGDAGLAADAPLLLAAARGGEVGDDAGPIVLAMGGKVCPGPHKSHVANHLYAEGGKIPAMVSPGEIYLNPEQVHKVVSEGVDPAEVGHKFSGKAKVQGDSLKNDTIPADLEEGGIVIDRKNMGSKEKRELFVHKTVAKHKAGRK